MKRLLEIRPGEGGDDAKLLVEAHARIYLLHAERTGMSASVETGGRGFL